MSHSFCRNFSKWDCRIGFFQLKKALANEYERRGKETSSEGPLNLFQSSAFCLGNPNGNEHYSERTHNHVNGEGSCSKLKTHPISPSHLKLKS